MKLLSTGQDEKKYPSTQLKGQLEQSNNSQRRKEPSFQEIKNKSQCRKRKSFTNATTLKLQDEGILKLHENFNLTIIY